MTAPGKKADTRCSDTCGRGSRGRHREALTWDSTTPNAELPDLSGVTPFLDDDAAVH
jgi:hypothetical protein